MSAQEPNKEIDHKYTDEIVCPHCGAEFSDSFEFDESGETDCYKCEKPFLYETHVEITYTTRKLPSKEQNEETV